MPNNDKSSAIRFLEANLRKGYSQLKLTQLLSQRGFKRDVIDESISTVNPSHFEAEAIQFISAILDKHIKEGTPTDKIITQLESKGIDHALVTKALSRLKGDRIKPSQVPHLSKTAWIIIACIGAGILLAGVILTFYEPGATGGVADCGSNKDCFIQLAQDCRPAIVREDITGSVLAYRSSSECAITKRFESFSPNEPPEVVSFLQGTQMNCRYEPGYFDTVVVEGLAGGMESCTGDLKDALVELQLAALSLET